jgi:hypothetical protein
MSSSFHASTVDWLGCWIAAGQVKPGRPSRSKPIWASNSGSAAPSSAKRSRPSSPKACSKSGRRSARGYCPCGAGTCSIHKSSAGCRAAVCRKTLSMTCSTCAAPSNRWRCAGPASGPPQEQVEAVLLAYNALERAVDSGIDYNRADQAFHECILAASHNQFIEQMIPALGALLAVCFEVSAADPDELRRTCRFTKTWPMPSPPGMPRGASGPA